MLIKKNVIDTYTLNKNKLTKINDDAKNNTTTIENIIKTKLKHELNNANIDYLYLKLYCNFDVFENADYFFTGLFKYNKDVFEITKDNKSNNIIIYNKDNKKDFTKKYLELCNEITMIGEFLYIDKINKLEKESN